MQLPAEHPYINLTFPPPPPTRPYVGLNMVMSLDGKITVGGKLEPGSLGSAFDRYTMTVLRHHFDAVICGGETMRRHPYYLGVSPEFVHLRKARGMADQPLTVVVTNSGSLPYPAPLFAGPKPPIILTSARACAKVKAQLGSAAVVHPAGDDRVELPQAFTLLREIYSVQRLLLEGGPRLNYEFLKEGAVDEVFLTIAPRLVGTASDLTLVMGEDILHNLPRLELILHFQHENELFLRYQVPRRD